MCLFELKFPLIVKFWPNLSFIKNIRKSLAIFKKLPAIINAIKSLFLKNADNIQLQLCPGLAVCGCMCLMTAMTRYHQPIWLRPPSHCKLWLQAERSEVIINKISSECPPPTTGSTNIHKCVKKNNYNMVSSHDKCFFGIPPSVL